MRRRFLTAHQTTVLQSILNHLSEEIGNKVQVTDFFSACLNQPIMAAIKERVITGQVTREDELKASKFKREMKVFQGEVLSNGLPYKVVVAVKKKAELATILGTHVSYKNWKRSTSPAHFDITAKAPGCFFGCPEPKVGRPSMDNFIMLLNVSPIKE